ncbi:hypothetical protein ACFSSA_07320 [Luteolibacter algae]|uniref:Glutathionylspermidine synthase n=1 Tax=Luteolibacter algae TaxID=454151 RepID=A0ABW5D7W5_9BACT
MEIALEDLKKALPEGGLFGGGNWQWSPQPLKLSAAEAREMTSLGHPLAKFQQASDMLYRRSAAGKIAPWLAELLDQGKPDWLAGLQREGGMAEQFPRVIRPDLILAKGHFAASELDSVPGGMGITAWLSKVYADAGFEVLGGPDGMVEGFRSLMPDGGDILVSEESRDYRPEMDWLASRLGDGWKTEAAESYVENGRDVYRFFENFDWKAIPGFRDLAGKSAKGEINVTPPFKPHLEEKLWLALLWSPSLKKLWEQTMRGSHLQRLRNLVPFGWVIDPEPLPPHAALPKLDVHSWKEVADFSQKERQLVLKISGFHESAWGSRGVFIGHDLSAQEWKERLDTALKQTGEQAWLMQEFHEGRRFEHPIYQEDGSVKMVDVRARLCPYFFTDRNGETSFGGCLATLVPADKKKIHGMSDGVLVPCIIGED